MIRLMKILGFCMAGTMTFFSPMQMTHGTNSCCAECQFKKEDEIEVVEEREMDLNKLKLKQR
tara:strand:- start:4513 stop:4698 length:186 start_codon:yes stop_codon:yes gene_type:complete